MIRFSEDDIIRMIKPNGWTYKGLDDRQIQDIKRRYQQAKKYLQSHGVSTLLNFRLNTLINELEELPDYIRKPVLSYAVMCGGLDGWKDPTKKW